MRKIDLMVFILALLVVSCSSSTLFPTAHADRASGDVYHHTNVHGYGYRCSDQYNGFLDHRATHLYFYFSNPAHTAGACF